MEVGQRLSGGTTDGGLSGLGQTGVLGVVGGAAGVSQVEPARQSLTRVDGVSQPASQRHRPDIVVVVVVSGPPAVPVQPPCPVHRHCQRAPGDAR